MGERNQPGKEGWRGVEPSALTLDDALHDVEWGKRPGDFFEYCAVDKTALEFMMRMPPADVGLAMQAVGAYCLTGAMPDEFDEYPLTAQMLAQTVTDKHKGRMDAVTLARYKAWAGGKKSAALRDEKAGKPDDRNDG